MIAAAMGEQIEISDKKKTSQSYISVVLTFLFKIFRTINHSNRIAPFKLTAHIWRLCKRVPWFSIAKRNVHLSRSASATITRF